MNKLYIISYDLSNPGRNYETLLKRIKNYPIWARLGGSAYLIYTQDTAVQIRDYLLGALDYNDKLYVGRMANEAAWRGLSDDVSNWIKDRQK